MLSKFHAGRLIFAKPPKIVGMSLITSGSTTSRGRGWVLILGGYFLVAGEYI